MTPLRPSWLRIATTDGVVAQALAVGVVTLAVSVAAAAHYLPLARDTGRGPIVFVVLSIAAACIGFALLLLGIAVHRALEVRGLLRVGVPVPATVTRRTWFFGSVLHYDIEHEGRAVDRWTHLAWRRRARHLAAGDAVTAIVDPAHPERTLLADLYRVRGEISRARG